MAISVSKRTVKLGPRLPFYEEGETETSGYKSHKKDRNSWGPCSNSIKRMRQESFALSLTKRTGTVGDHVAFHKEDETGIICFESHKEDRNSWGPGRISMKMGRQNQWLQVTQRGQEQLGTRLQFYEEYWAITVSKKTGTVGDYVAFQLKRRDRMIVLKGQGQLGTRLQFHE